MHATETALLLRRYAGTGDSPAFTEIVRRYVDWVYSTAARRLGEDRHLAADVTQLVFIDLAAKAKTLPPEVQLGGWLHHHTCFRAATVIRGERRRREREQKAAAMNAPAADRLADPELAHQVDQALERLPARDRDALVLRYFESAPLAAIGQAMGISEDAAQKLVGRALEKLRRQCAPTGRSAPTAAAIAAACAGAIQAAPAGLAAVAAQAALAGAAATRAAAGSTARALLTSLKLKTVVAVGAGLAAGLLAVRERRAIGPWRAAVGARLEALVGHSSPGPGPAGARLSATAAPPAAPDIEGQLDRILQQETWSKHPTEFVSFLGHLRAADMRRALGYLDGRAPSRGLATLRSFLVQRWAELDPRPAVAWWQSRPTGDQNDLVKIFLARELATVDPAAAIQFGGPNPNIFRDWARRSPAAAAVCALQLSAGPDRGYALTALAKAWADADPPAAVRWAGGLAGEADRADALRGILPSLAQVDPGLVADYLGGLAAQASMAEVGGRFASTWAANDPAAAAAWATALPAGSALKAVAVPRVIERWATADAAAAGHWLEGLPAGPERDQWVQVYLKPAVADEPQLAAQLADGLGDPAARAAALETVARSWVRQDPVAAAQWAATLSPADDPVQRTLGGHSPGP